MAEGPTSGTESATLISAVGPGPGTDLRPGETVGGFVIERKLGEGGFGAVYRATQPLIGRAVAIKVLSAQLAKQPDLMARFVDEARAANQFRHRNIIDVFQFGQLADGRPFQVMEFLEGETLAQHLLREGRLPLEAALPLFRAVARALDVVHAAGIVHRDLKPDNVFLTLDDEGRCLPKLLDFGIAKLAPDPLSARRTKTGVPMGTPSYMSPEQCRGLHVDARSDIYAFGVLVYETLTGRPPFGGDSLLDVMNAHLQQPPPALRSLAPELPEQLEPVVAGALAKAPEGRPARASDFVAELTAAARAAGHSVPEDVTQPPLKVQRTLHAAPVLSPAHVSPARVSQPPRRWSLAAGLGAAALTAVGLIAASARSAPQAPLAVAPRAEPTPTPTTPPLAPIAVPAPTPVAPAPAPARPAQVRVTLRTGDAKGAVLLGDVLLGETGQAVLLPTGDAPLTLTVRASGHTPATVVLVPSQDRELEVPLQRAPAPARKHAAPSVPRALEDPFANP